MSGHLLRSVTTIAMAFALAAGHLPLAGQELQASPRVFREAGGIIFGMAATPGAGVPHESAPTLRYDRAARNGRRLLAVFGGGVTAAVADVQDELLLPAAAFVQDGRPVVVNIRDLSGAGVCARNPGRLGLVELHPAFLDTRVGASLIRADTMVWPVLDPDDVNARGEGFPVDRLSPSLRGEVNALRQLYAADPAGRVSNINDVQRPATFSLLGGEIRLNGLPRIEILARHETRQAPEVALLRGLSEQLTFHQAGLFSVADKPAYDVVVGVYRLAGFLNYVKGANAEGWRSLVSTLPATRRTVTTATIICTRCAPETLFKKVTECQAVSGR